MSETLPFARFLLLLGLGFFFGLAFEEFYAREKLSRPGGVRTFPLLAMAGALLYRLDPARVLPLTAGLIVLGAWLFAFYRHRLNESDAAAGGGGSLGLMVPVCNILAFLLGPVALAEPAWVAVGMTVAAVLLLTARERLHGLATRIDGPEIVTAGKFLLLTGFILPLLPDHPVTDLTPITPRQVWLAVLAVSTLSYASYLLERYVSRGGSGLVVALLGGLYSSTGTTVVLARRAGSDPTTLPSAQTGIILATAMMYLRMLAIIALFSRPMALSLAPALVGLSVGGFALAGLWRTLRPAAASPAPAASRASNPLELGAAAVFAALFVVISLASGWARDAFGAAGIYALAAIVGFADIDPFVLSLVQGESSGATPLRLAVVAVLIAAASNNVLKAAYAVAFAGRRGGAVPAAALLLLALIGVGIAWWFAARPG